MSDKYMLTPFRRRAVALLAIVFLVLGAHRTLTLVLPLAAPQYMTVVWHFDDGRHEVAGDPFALLPDEPRATVVADPSARARFLARLDQPSARLRLFLFELLARLPELGLKFALGIALWRVSRPTADAALRGLPWLVRAGWASVAMAVIVPVVSAAEAGFLLRGVIPSPDLFLFDLDLDVVESNLLLAAGALAAAWTLAAGLRARAELADIV